jgi:hypothetical protein
MADPKSYSPDDPKETGWAMLSIILRPADATEAQKAEARRGCQWLQDHLGPIKLFSRNPEAVLLGHVLDHWQTHGEAPPFSVLKHSAGKLGDPHVNAHLDAFEQAMPFTHGYGVEDLDFLLGEKVTEWQVDTAGMLLSNAAMINRSGQKFKEGGKEIVLKGPQDAVSYVLRKLDGNILNMTTTPTRVSAEDSSLTRKLLAASITPKENRRFVTGLKTFDEKLGLRKGWLVGVLGIAGNGKSTLCRTLLYNAAMNGASVLQVPLEMSLEEETLAFVILHAFRQFAPECAALRIAKDHAAKSKLSTAAREFLLGPVCQDFAACFDGQEGRGRIVIARPTSNTLDDVLGLIKAEDVRHPLDIACIDHPKCIAQPGKNPRAESEKLVSKLRELSSYHREGEGLGLLLPLQANREGWRTAAKAGGVWELAAIHEDSAYGFYADLVVGVFRDDEIAGAGKMLVSVPKFRHGLPPAPFKLTVTADSQAVTEPSSVTEEALNLDEALDDI